MQESMCEDLKIGNSQFDNYTHRRHRLLKKQEKPSIICKSSESDIKMQMRNLRLPLPAVEIASSHNNMQISGTKQHYVQSEPAHTAAWRGNHSKNSMSGMNDIRMCFWVFKDSPPVERSNSNNRIRDSVGQTIGGNVQSSMAI